MQHVTGGGHDGRCERRPSGSDQFARSSEKSQTHVSQWAILPSTRTLVTQTPCAMAPAPESIPRWLCDWYQPALLLQTHEDEAMGEKSLENKVRVLERELLLVDRRPLLTYGGSTTSPDPPCKLTTGDQVPSARALQIPTAGRPMLRASRTTYVPTGTGSTRSARIWPGPWTGRWPG